MKRMLAVAVLHTPGIPLSAQPADDAGVGQGITLQDLQGLAAVSQLALSPDGRRLAFNERGRIMILATDRPDSPRELARGSMPVWSRDGGKIAFFAAAPDGRQQIFVIDATTGHTEQLTFLEGGVVPGGMSWSQTGPIAFAAYPTPASGGTEQARTKDSTEVGSSPVALDENSPDGLALAGIFPGVEARGAERRTPVLFVYSPSTRATRQLTSSEPELGDFVWSPDGKTIAAISNEGMSAGFPKSGVYLVDALTGEVRQVLPPEDPRKATLVWSPDGKRLAFSHFSSADIRRHGVTVLELTQGSIASSEQVLSEPVDALAWGADGRFLVATVNRSVTKPVVMIDLEGGESTVLGAERHVASSLTVAVSGSGAIAWAESRGDVPVAIQFRAPGSPEPELLYDPNPQVAEWALGRQEIVRWRNTRGDDREGVLITPHPSRGSGPFPLIVSAYTEGSHQNGFQASTWPGFGNQALASLGYAVFFPGPRLPWMYAGAATDEPIGGPQGWQVAVDDVESGVDLLIDRGIADPTRMAIMGFSNGGAATTAVITSSQRYSAAIVIAPANLNWLELALLSDDREGRFVPTKRFVGIDRELWQAPEEYLRGSPVFRLDRVSTPVMLAVGDKDYPSFLLPTLEMYLALRRMGRSVELVRYPDAGHGFFGADATDLNARILTFLETRLGTRSASGNDDENRPPDVLLSSHEGARGPISCPGQGSP